MITFKISPFPKNLQNVGVILSLTSLVSGLTITSASAQLFRNSPNSSTNNNSQISQSNYNNSNFNIPAGTTIPVFYDQAEKILVTKEETLPVTLRVGANLKDRQGRVMIPYGTEILGKIQPSGNGSQFVGEYLILNNQQYPINANSRVVTTTEIIKQGANTGAILKSAAIGAAAATVIAGITGDKAIATEEILGGTGLGALAGWIWGGKKTELISINPNVDLDLTFF